MSIGTISTSTAPGLMRWIALLVAVLALVSFAVEAYSVTSAHLTGRAVYNSGLSNVVTLPVTRETHPVEFQLSLQRSYWSLGTCGVVGLIAFFFYRKLSE